tara:strand:+ start:25 stop:657 length:633 start_codon:yes stop_codon:yes gene_type:complete
MAKVGAQRAAVLTGKSKSTIQRAMNSGKISYELDQNGRRIIDVSEIERVYGIKKQVEASITVKEKKPITTQQSVSVEALVEKERMSMRIKMLEQQLSTANEHIDDLKTQRDKWQKQASQMLITTQYSQKQAEELRNEIKTREERARKKRIHNATLKKEAETSQIEFTEKKSIPAENLEKQVKRLKPENENMDAQTQEEQSVFRFWKRVKG